MNLWLNSAYYIGLWKINIGTNYGGTNATIDVSVPYINIKVEKKMYYPPVITLQHSDGYRRETLYHYNLLILCNT